MSISIRPATPADLPLIGAFICELAEYEKLAHEVRFDEAVLGAKLFGPRPYAEVVIGEVDGAAQGFALFFHNFSTFEGRPGVYLEDLFVRPAARGAGLGKALLAHLDDEGLDRWMRKKGLSQYTDNTIADPDALRSEMARIRDRGWAIDNEERTLGMRCVAAPVYNVHGEAIAGISVSGPTVRLPDAVLRKVDEIHVRMRNPNLHD